jgi:integrase
VTSCIFRSSELGRSPTVDEFVFCHRNGTATGSFKKGFERILREAGVLHGSDGKRWVPYSLRHTYATMRISEGVSVFQLAANMGTSVEMIENFYGKKRVRDPKIATEITKRSGGGFNLETDRPAFPRGVNSLARS